MDTGASIVALETYVELKAIVFDVDASAAHIPIVFEMIIAIDRVSDVKSVTCKVGHVLRKVIVFEINVGLRVRRIGTLVSLEIGRHDVYCAAKGTNVLQEEIFLEQHRALVRYYQE